MFAGIICSDPTSTFGKTQGMIRNQETPPYYVGHRLHFECPSSHRLVGSKNRTCQENGQWSGTISVCELKGNRLKVN